MDRDTFLSAVSELISSNYPEGDPQRGLKASEVGLLIRRGLPEVLWETLGYLKLKEILADLEARRLIRTGFDEKHAFTVWPPDAPASQTERSATQPLQEGLAQRERFRPLRKDVWSAFVTAWPPGKRFIHRRDGTVRMGFAEPPGPTSDWVEIKPLDQDSQKAWANEFLAQRGLEQDEGVRRALESPTWYRELTEKIREVNPLIATHWNQRRSMRVVQAVQDWIKSNDLPPESVFEPYAPAGRPTVAARRSAVTGLRGGLLAAVQQMTVDELLKIKIPTRCLLTVFRPDLLPPGESATNRHE